MALILQNQTHHLPVFRTSSDSFGYMEQNNKMMEKRQLFLRSYQFSRKKSLTERIEASFFRVKRVMWVKLRSARRIRKLVWSRLRWGFSCRKRKFVPLHYHNHYNSNNNGNSSCFW